MTATPPTPESPCCIGRSLHAGPECVWPNTVPHDSLLIALGRALWEAVARDEVYAHVHGDGSLCVDGDLRLPDDVMAIVRTIVP